VRVRRLPRRFRRFGPAEVNSLYRRAFDLGRFRLLWKRNA